MTRLVTLDNNWLLWRAWSVVGKTAPKRLPNLVLQWICQDLIDLRARHFVACVDARSFRYDVWPEYKGTRKEEKGGAGDLLQLKDGPYPYERAVLDRLRQHGFAVHREEGYEADDLMTSYAKQYPAYEIVIESRDKDLLQALSDRVTMYTPAMNKGLPIRWDVAMLWRKWKLTPKQMLDYQTLIGDKIDNVPGILGDKTARKLITQHGSLFAFFKTKEGKEFFRKHSNELTRNRLLVKMKEDAPVLPEAELQIKKGMPDRFTPMQWHALQDFVSNKRKSLFG